MKDILKARSENPFPGWGRVLTIIVGLALLSYSMKTFFTVNIDQMKLTFPYALFGISCLFIGGFEKQVFVSPDKTGTVLSRCFHTGPEHGTCQDEQCRRQKKRERHIGALS